MVEILVPIFGILAIGLFIGSWVFYLRRVRQGRADPVVDPSWPSTVLPSPRHLHDPAAGHHPTSSLYFDPNESSTKRGFELPTNPE